MSNILINGLSYPIMQINGQKIIGPPHGFENFEPASEYNEVFITNLPRDIFEDTLMPLFSTCGVICKLRLMMCFSGHNRGFCYVLFFSKEARDMCIKLFRNYSIRNQEIYAHRSTNKRVLVMGNIDESIVTLEEVQAFCFNETEALKIEYELDLWKRPKLLIYYEKHHDAAMARRKFMQYLFSFGRSCFVRWVNKN